MEWSTSHVYNSTVCNGTETFLFLYGVQYWILKSYKCKTLFLKHTSRVACLRFSSLSWPCCISVGRHPTSFCPQLKRAALQRKELYSHVDDKLCGYIWIGEPFLLDGNFKTVRENLFKLSTKIAAFSTELFFGHLQKLKQRIFMTWTGMNKRM